MNILILLALAFAAYSIIYIWNPKSKYAKGIRLKNKFESISNLNGMTKKELISIVGRPYSISSIGNGQFLQWYETGFYIIIYFDADGKFSAITHKKCQKLADQLDSE